MKIINGETEKDQMVIFFPCSVETLNDLKPSHILVC